jgi:hypothetical protein
MVKHIAVEGKRIYTKDINEVIEVIRDKNINYYCCSNELKERSIDELKALWEDIFNRSGYHRFCVELSYNNESIYWIGLCDEGDSSYTPLTLYNNPKVKSSVLKEIMTFAEATEKWGLGESTLRMAVNGKSLVESQDYRKSGKVWIITKDAMIRIYGEPLQE